MPVGSRFWRWFSARWSRSAAVVKVGLATLLVFAGLVYVFYGPLVFDATYWAVGKLARVRADRRIRLGASFALVAVYLAVLGVSASTRQKVVPGGSTGSPVVAAAAPSPSANLTDSATASAYSGPSEYPITFQPVASQSASAAPSNADSDDEDGGVAGSSFAPAEKGVLPPPAAGSPSDRLPGEPDAALTPGALNPAVTQATIHATICVSGWTATIRPSSSFTTALKIKQMVEYGYSDTRTSSYEEDHLISLELGGASADPRNLWPEPYAATLADGRSTGARTKDGFETKLKSKVCAGTLTLAEAQSSIGIHWVHAYYGIAMVASSTPTPLTTSPDPIAKPTAQAVPAKPETPAPVAPVPPDDLNAAAKAAGATAICADLTWSFSPSRSGTCSKHGGVHWWTGNVGASGPGGH